jgi:signal transduction histidine kinase/ligand-binding sensor domain-containing protein
MNFRITSILIFIVYFLQPMFSVNLKDIVHFTSESGLSNNSISCIAQDKLKFIWIGTSDGLNRFDGTSFKIFRNIPDDSTSLQGNDISKILIDSNGTLWIGTLSNGVSTFDTNRETFRKIKILGRNPNDDISNNNITGITEDKIGNIWVSNFEGLMKINKATKHIDQYYSQFPADLLLAYLKNNRQQLPFGIERIANSIPIADGKIFRYRFRDSCIAKYGIEKTSSILNEITKKLYEKLTGSQIDDQITCIYTDVSGKIWIGYMAGSFSSLDPITNIYVHYPFIKKINRPGVATNVSSIYQYKNELFVGYEIGLIEVLNLETGNITSLSDQLNLTHITQIERFDDKYLWVASGLNIVLLDVHKKTFSAFSNLYNSREITSPQTAIRIFTDIQHNRWIGTSMNGFYLVYEPKGFKIYNSTNALSSDYVDAIIQDKKKNYWVGYYTSAIDRVSPDWKKCKTYSYKPGVKGSFAGESVFAVFEDSDGNIWVNNYLSGLQLYNPSNDDFSVFRNDPENPNSIPVNDTRSITEDSHGNLWLATHSGGLCKFDRKHKLFKTYKADYNNWHDKLPTDWLTCAVLDKKGFIWVATVDGFSIFDTTRQVFKTYKNSNSALPHNYVTNIFIDSYQNAWIGTKGGLAIFDRQGQQIYKIMKEDGLPNNEIKAIIQDNNKRFWISTGLGIFSCEAYNAGHLDIELLKKSIAKFDISDGISSNDFCDRSCFKTGDGMLMFGGRSGITAFYPDSIKRNLVAPSVFFSNLKLFNTSVLVNKKYGDNVLLSKPLYLTDTITFSYKQNVLSFEFVALNFIQANKNKYKYKLEGFDDDWQFLSNKNEIIYTNLRPGKYILKVLASNNEGIWNNKGKSLVIFVTPPFWQTWWFRLLIIIIFILFLISFYYLRLSRIHKMNSTLQELVLKRTIEIEEKNQELIAHTKALNTTNAQLEERQQLIEEQTEELTSQRDELTQLNNTKDKLFSILAHDMKGPFNAILGFSDLLLENLESYTKDKIESQLKIIRDASLFSYELLENLLQWTRAQRGMIEFVPSKINVREFIVDVLKMPKQQASRKEIAIEIKVTGTEKPIKADPNMLSTIARNIINNAIKYSYIGSKIIIELNFEGDSLCISIADNGIGVSNDIKDKIFRLNEVFSKSGTAGEKGTGLGLFISADFVNRHKGKIWVESEEGKGSTFFFTIPYI